MRNGFKTDSKTGLFLTQNNIDRGYYRLALSWTVSDLDRIWKSKC